MLNIIKDLQVTYILTNEQQVQAIIRSLSNYCEYLKVNFTHNDGITTFADVACYVELKNEHLWATKPTGQAYIIESQQAI